MNAIDWKTAQQHLAAVGYNPGPDDGLPGRTTYAALFGYTARRQPDAVLRSIASVAPAVLAASGIAGSPQRLAEFLAQTSHECAAYTHFEENLRYSAKRLMAVWPSRFPTLARALPYAWDPTDPDREDEALANLVYGSRMGNEVNGTADNDGWEDRGRGMLQHTGAAEYALLKQRLGLNPDDVADPANSLKAAADYWTRRNVNGAVDAGDYLLARRRVNGGTLGLAEIAADRARLLRVLT